MKVFCLKNQMVSSAVIGVVVGILAFLFTNNWSLDNFGVANSVIGYTLIPSFFIAVAIGSAFYVLVGIWGCDNE